MEQVIWDRLSSLLEHSEFIDRDHCSWVGRGTVAKYCLLSFPFLNIALGIGVLFSIACEIHHMSSLKIDAIGCKAESL